VKEQFTTADAESSREIAQRLESHTLSLCPLCEISVSAVVNLDFPDIQFNLNRYSPEAEIDALGTPLLILPVSNVSNIFTIERLA
jgi:hypothetical protein